MDWLRLQKALSVEAERGFNDLVGNQYRFSEFLSLNLASPPAELSTADQDKLRDIAQQFDRYSDLTFAQRQHLVAETRRFLHQTSRRLEQHQATQLSLVKEQSQGSAAATLTIAPETTAKPRPAKVP
ncbi:MAG TPA: DNA helicase RecG, partial [Allocoleopsis sp.]